MSSRKGSLNKTKRVGRRTSLGGELRSVLQALGGGDSEAARAQRVAEVRVRWKSAVEAVYQGAAGLVLDHTNAVYIVSPEKTSDPAAAKVGKGRTLLIVYADDAMVRSDIDARQEFLKLKLNELGERIDVLSIKASRRDMLKRHPYRCDETAPRREGGPPQKAPESQIDPAAARRLKEQASDVEPAALRESIIKALEANSKPL